jgi:hypothetical protein
MKGVVRCIITSLLQAFSSFNLICSLAKSTLVGGNGTYGWGGGVGGGGGRQVIK